MVQLSFVLLKLVMVYLRESQDIMQSTKAGRVAHLSQLLSLFLIWLMWRPRRKKPASDSFSSFPSNQRKQSSQTPKQPMLNPIDGKEIIVAQRPAMLLHGKAVNPDTKQPISYKEREFYRQYLELNRKRIPEIALDCVDLVQKTVTPDVFFSRYEELVQRSEELIYLHTVCHDPSLSSSISALSNILVSHDALVYDFIQRSHFSMVQKASTLKTEKGRYNRYQRYYEVIQQYQDQLPAQAKFLLEEYRKTDLKQSKTESISPQ